MLIAALTLLSVTVSAAELNGFWDGSGVLTESIGRVVRCESLSASLETKGTNLEFYYVGHCDTYAWEDTLIFNLVHGTELWLNGVRVGTVTSQAFAFTWDQPGISKKYTADIRLQKTGDIRLLDDVIQGVHSSQVSADLHPVP